MACPAAFATELPKKRPKMLGAMSGPRLRYGFDLRIGRVRLTDARAHNGRNLGHDALQLVRQLDYRDRADDSERIREQSFQEVVIHSADTPSQLADVRAA